MPKVKLITVQATETPIPIMPPEKREPELFGNGVVDGVLAVLPPFELLVCLGRPSLRVVEAGEEGTVSVPVASQGCPRSYIKLT